MPVRSPFAGCTVIPAGFSTTRQSASSWYTRRGIASAHTSPGASRSASRYSTRSPHLTLWAGRCTTAPFTSTPPSFSARFARLRVMSPGSRRESTASIRSPASRRSTTITTSSAPGSGAALASPSPFPASSAGARALLPGALQPFVPAAARARERAGTPAASASLPESSEAASAESPARPRARCRPFRCRVSQGRGCASSSELWRCRPRAPRLGFAGMAASRACHTAQRYHRTLWHMDRSTYRGRLRRCMNITLDHTSV